MLSRPVVRRVLLAVSTVLVVALVIVGVLGVGLVRRSFPQLDGTIHLRDLSGPVEVVRDGQGVPQIYADTSEDLFRAQGFVTAQDRFFQMDVVRRAASGRLAALVGEPGVDSDKVTRTLGWRRVAQQELGLLQPDTQRYLRAYTDGVNSYLERRGTPSRVSTEYVVLGLSVPGKAIEPWTPVDSLVYLKALAWDLKGNYDTELLRARLSAVLTPRQVTSLFPAYDATRRPPILSAADWSPTTQATTTQPPATTTGSTTTPRPPVAALTAVPAAVPASYDTGQVGALTAAARTLDSVPVIAGRGEGLGSNSWVVSGRFTTTGKPMLANDPHLGLALPSIWYQTGLHCRTLSAACQYDVSGFTMPGLPGVVIGHNSRIAWGFTNLNPDVTDLYLEKVTGASYERDGIRVPLKVRRERIAVAGGSPVDITVRETVHGPLLSDADDAVREAGQKGHVPGTDPSRYDVALAWTALSPGRTADALFGMGRAHSWAEFRSAAMDFAAPSQNMVFADTEGNIGYQAPGVVPIRRSSVAGSPPGFWPAPGWRSEFDWQGYVPYDRLPSRLNPPEGMIVTANNAVTTATSPYLTTEWAPGYRSSQILHRLQQATAGGRKISVDDMTRIQMDSTNPFARSLVRLLLRIDLGGDDFTRDGQQLLRGWDYTTPASGRQSAAAAYYNAVWRRVLDLTFEELPKDLAPTGSARDQAVVEDLLQRPTDPWWDDVRTPAVTERRDEILRRALQEARLDLTREMGKDPGEWTWGQVHRLELKHVVLGGDGVPGIVHAAVNEGPWGLDGGQAVVNANAWDASKGFEVGAGPSMRMVVDLADLDRSRWVLLGGQSGHPFDGHYNDQSAAWRSGRTFAWPSSPEAVKRSGKHTLTFTSG
ncbi:penicillin acylase family protein [Luteipulveratus sp. YIM 133132]|uniref:penicillin acylase family protein n=1 Tax=Luteipulveratus flavus TaxID=3031728 RepID=UPI0023AFD423|nr:penicillin acylase family protein [Luteipulveratus sp. YIM 133132]MDE9364241.1 penicillin acylase family protein [Luteipulveratus sp. YIM 133132]